MTTLVYINNKPFEITVLNQTLSDMVASNQLVFLGINKFYYVLVNDNNLLLLQQTFINNQIIENYTISYDITKQFGLKCVNKSTPAIELSIQQVIYDLGSNITLTDLSQINGYLYSKDNSYNKVAELIGNDFDGDEIITYHSSNKLKTSNILINNVAIKSEIDTDYLKKSDAISTYLTITNASNTYLSLSNAINTYLTITNASNTYLSQTNAASTYLSQTNANLDYLKKIDASTTYLSITNANSTYAKLASSNTFSNNINITGNNVINFGSDITKEQSAGMITYGKWDSNSSLSIVGAGLNNTTRHVKIYDYLTIDQGSLNLINNTGILTLNSSRTAGSSSYTIEFPTAAPSSANSVLTTSGSSPFSKLTWTDLNPYVNATTTTFSNLGSTLTSVFSGVSANRWYMIFISPLGGAANDQSPTQVNMAIWVSGYQQSKGHVVSLASAPTGSPANFSTITVSITSTNIYIQNNNSLTQWVRCNVIRMGV